MRRPDFDKFAAWERDWKRSQPVDVERNMRIFEALYHEAVELGVLPPKEPLAGIEGKIRLAQILNLPATPR